MSYRIGFLFAIIFITILFAITGNVSASPSLATPTPRPTLINRAATAAELAQARVEWEKSAHADTYDNGMGANTTCARCKSPTNWAPTAIEAQAQALDCNACKRIPGAPRPDLSGGTIVFQDEWQSISCAICHQPMGNSFSIAISFWNNETKQYEAVPNVTALCDKCHEGRHGFHVAEEQELSKAHNKWDCTQCHGAHGAPARCTDCHDPTKGQGAQDHARHPQVNCTACHDAGDLSVGLLTNATSRMAATHEGTYITLRFAHTLTSWPSHNLQTPVDCRRCHHPQGKNLDIVASKIGCRACHSEGAMLQWCIFFPRNEDPNAGDSR